MKLRHRLAGAVLAFALPAAAHASTYSDIWYDPEQPGWGVNVQQQLETAFVTLYTYGADGRPTWYVASSAHIVAYAEPGGLPVFSGTLYRTEGTFHGAPYDPSRAKTVPVGELSLEVLDRNRMRVHYTADGVSSVKEVRRYTFQQPIELANYAAQGLLRQVRGSQPVGTLYLQADALLHLNSETGQGFLRTDDNLGHRCEYRGPYQVTGKLVRFSGDYSCSGGDLPAGAFEITELEVTQNGFTAAMRKTAGSDSQWGKVAAVRW